MVCKSTQERLAQRRPGERDDAAERHLAGCASCRADAALWAELGALRAPDVDLWPRLAARIPPPAPSWLETLADFLVPQRAFAGAVVLAVALGVAGGGWLGARFAGTSPAREDPLAAVFDVPSLGVAGEEP